MSPDWNIVATIAAPVIALFAGALMNRWLESRPILISYLSHVSAFVLNLDNGQQMQANTHSVVLKNSSRRAATNVRLHHILLPSFTIWPQIVHHVEQLADATQDIVIPTLVPGELITVSYLYLPPITVGQVNSGIKSDQGFSKQIPVLLQRQYSRWFNLIAALLMLIGLITVLYVIYSIVAHIT